jgi:hypothetical protein
VRRHIDIFTFALLVPPQQQARDRSSAVVLSRAHPPASAPSPPPTPPDKLADHGDVIAAIEGVPLDTIFLDAAAQEKREWRGRRRGFRGLTCTGWGTGAPPPAAAAIKKITPDILSSSFPSQLRTTGPSKPVAELVRLRGVRNVIFWAEDPTALVAAHFAAAFFGALGLPRVSVIEAYTIALYSVQVRGRQLLGAAECWVIA